jgi:hypothetical protein
LTSATGTRQFPILLRASLSDVLESIFGRSGMEAVLHHVGQGSIAENPVEFQRRLSAIFGSGSEVVESQIVKDLYRRVGLRFDPAEKLGFGESVEKARKWYGGRLEIG